jgi:hypothetical protein
MTRLFHESPLGFSSSGAVAGRSAARTRSFAASPFGIGTGRCCTTFLPLPFRELGIISRGASRSACYVLSLQLR